MNTLAEMLKLAAVKQGMVKEAPFRSQAQRGLFYAKARRGEMSMKTVRKWEAETPKGKKLPKRLHKAATEKTREQVIEEQSDVLSAALVKAILKEMKKKPSERKKKVVIHWHGPPAK